MPQLQSSVLVKAAQGANGSDVVQEPAKSKSEGGGAAAVSEEEGTTASGQAATTASAAGTEQTLASTEQVKSTATPWAAAAQGAGISPGNGVLSPAKRYDDLHETLLRFTRDTLRKSARFGEEDEKADDDVDVGGVLSKRTQQKAQGPEDLARLHSSETAFLLTVWRRTPYRVGAFPLSLNAGSEEAGTACVKRLDSESGSTWYFRRRSDVGPEFWGAENESSTDDGDEAEDGQVSSSFVGGSVSGCSLSSSSSPFASIQSHSCFHPLHNQATTLCRITRLQEWIPTAVSRSQAGDA